MLRLLDLRLNLLDRLIRLEAVVGRDALDPDFGQARDVVGRDLAAQLLQERLQA
jgi:hypothetical protein